MREIKFRCWETKAKSYRDIESIEFFKGNLDVVTTVNDNGTDPQPVIGKEFILEQYTGLKDKNGKEIYDGDIVKDAACEWEVSFENGKFVCSSGSIKTDLYDLADIEFVGNIHENIKKYKKTIDL